MAEKRFSKAELETALRNAHAAGDIAAAQRIAAALSSTQGEGAPPIPQPMATTAPQEPPGMLEGVARAGAQGLTFGFSDELAGALAAGAAMMPGGVSPGDAYTMRRDLERQRLEEFAEEHPWVALASEAGGGLLTGVGAGAAAARAIPALGKTLARLPWYSRIPATGAAGATGGAASGALTGAGQAPTMADVPAYAARGAGLGAAIGGPLAMAGSAIGSGIRGGRELFRRTSDPEVVAARQMQRAAQRSGLGQEGALERAQAMGPSGTLADVSEAHRELLESAAHQPGAARDMAMDALTKRSVKQADELLEQLGPGQRNATLRSIKSFRKNQASPVYNQAFDEGVPHTDTLEQLFQDIDELSPGLWTKAKRFGLADLRNRGSNLGEEALEMNARPSLRGWQYIQRRLRSEADRAYKAGDADEGNIIRATHARLMHELDSLNPTFKEARRMWSGTKQFEDMMKSSDRFMTMPADDFEDVVMGLSSVDREAVKVGAIQAIQNRIQQGQFTQDVARFFRTPAMQKKMRLLFDDQKEFIDFQNRLRASTQGQRTYDKVRGGSDTARREAAKEVMNDWIGVAMDMAADAATGAPLASPNTLARMAMRSVGKLGPLRQEESRAELAKQLLEQDPVRRSMQRLTNEALLAPRPVDPAEALRPFIFSAGVPAALPYGRTR